MQEDIIFMPDAADFIEMWSHFNKLAHESGIVKSAISRHGTQGSNWLHYYLFSNNFQTIGQSLLEYCMLEILDIAATDKFSDFDLTGYALEPEGNCHLGENVAVRQALDDEDIFHLLTVYSLEELRQKLHHFLDKEGSLKVLVLPLLEVESASQIFNHIETSLFNRDLDCEYIVLLPCISQNQEVSWSYKIYNNEGATGLTMIQNLID